jgi:hypothetical protein
MKKFPAMSLEGLSIRSLVDLRVYVERKQGWDSFFKDATKSIKKLNRKARSKKN